MDEIDKRRLEKILEDPLAVFDYINQKIWKDPNEPEIAKLISEAKNWIQSFSYRPHQYLIVANYMALLREKFSGKKDFLDVVNETMRNIRNYS